MNSWSKQVAVGLLLVVLAAGAVWPGPRSPRLSGQAFLQQAELIFAGRLLSRESFRPAGSPDIFTRYLFEVREVVKGQAGPQVELIEYGGTVGDRTYWLSNTPRYEVGGEYVIFAYTDLLRHRRTWAGSLGQLPVLRDAEGRQLVRVYPSHPLLEVLGPVPVLEEWRRFAEQTRKVLERLDDAQE